MEIDNYLRKHIRDYCNCRSFNVCPPSMADKMIQDLLDAEEPSGNETTFYYKSVSIWKGHENVNTPIVKDFLSKLWTVRI